MNVLLGALKSKTVWFGLAQPLLPYITALLNGMPVDKAALLTTIVTGIGTIVLRTVTSQSLADKGKPVP